MCSVYVNINVLCSTETSTVAMAIHFLGGSFILIAGCIQLISSVRTKYPTFHHYVGYAYITSSILASVGGLVFILTHGCIGGAFMDIGFSVYGISMLVCAIYTAQYARQKDFVSHRAWAIRLFALGIGSWLYRVEYATQVVCHIVGAYCGHTLVFTGWFDYMMDFAFFVPNLLIAQLFIQGYHLPYFYTDESRDTGKSQKLATKSRNRKDTILWIFGTVIFATAVLLFLLTLVYGGKRWVPGMFGQLNKIVRKHPETS